MSITPEEAKSQKIKVSKTERATYSLAIIISSVLMILLVRFCANLAKDGDTDFPIEYYQSIEREKYYRDMGYTELAGMEKRDRNKKLKDGTYRLEKR